MTVKPSTLCRSLTDDLRIPSPPIPDVGPTQPSGRHREQAEESIMESPPISPISCHSPPPFPHVHSRAYHSTLLDQSHSSSMESLSWRQSTYSRTSSDDSLYLPLENHRPNRRRAFSGRNSSPDSLYVPVNSRQTIKRWNGITREAINWNSLPRDPELFFPTGNCLVYLYPAGHSQRGPSFRIPYHILLHSGCQPLVRQCLVSTLNIYSPDRDISKSLSHGQAGYSLSEDTRTYLYLYPPAGLSRDESYSYHITTRNFFAWLLGVPLVGVDPVSALLGLKARMDIWRDPDANNFEAVFKYAKQQAYGDFEVIQIKMDQQTESEENSVRAARYPSAQVQTLDHQYRHNAGMIRRNDSLKQRLRSSMHKSSRPHIASQDTRVAQAPLPVEKRQSLPRLATYSTLPSPPFPAETEGAIRRIDRPARAQSSNAVYSVRTSEMMTEHRYTSSSASLSPVSPITPVDTDGIDAALQRLTRPPSADSVVTFSNSQATKANKKKHRVSWADNNPTVAEARSSQTDVTYPNMQGFGLQSAQASSSAMNVSQPSPVTRRSLSSLPSSSNAVAGPSKRASLSASTTRLPLGEHVRVARPMSTASLVSIPMMHQGSAPIQLESCSCCGKTRRPEHGSFHQHERPPPRPASTRSMKSFRSTRSWRSIRSIRSSLSLRSIRSSMSLNSIRSYLSRKSTTNKSFADIRASMKDRRSAFKARLKTDKKKDLKVDTENSGRPENLVQSSDPVDYTIPRPRSRYRASLNAVTSAPVELEAEPVAMKTVPELSDPNSDPWAPDSHSDSPLTPPEDHNIVTTTFRPKEIYTSREYRHQPAARRTGNVTNLLRFSDQDLGPDSFVLDIGTPGGFEENFVDTLITQLEAASVVDRVPSKSKGKGKAKARVVDVEEAGVWMGMTSSVGIPRLEVKTMG